MNSTWIGFHQNCVLECKVVRKNNRRTLALLDKTCGWLKILIYSKEKLKNLFDKERISNLLYLEGLKILKDLRVKKQKDICKTQDGE